MTFLTLDQTIEKLLLLKASGLPGDSAVAIPCFNNNGQSGFMQRIEHVGRSAVAKTEFEKGWGVCQLVSLRGVEIVSIA
jgi:hypothetical protein